MMAERMMCIGGDVRCIAEWRFEDGGFVAVHVGGKVSTADAMEWVEKMFAIKRAEIEKQAPSSMPESNS
jgi:hypothetical protein